MTIRVEYTARVTESQLQSGVKVFVASIDELPGVFAQAETEQGALDELFALAENLHERIGLPVFGLRTPAVESWSWQTLAPGGTAARRYGSDPEPNVLLDAAAGQR